ncbi:MAG: DUF6529 family protein [Acidimicrobiales bacterium]
MPTDRSEANNWLAAAFLTGAVVVVLLGVYSRYHLGTGDAVALLFFSDQLKMKTWLALIAGLFAVFQLVSSLVIYSKIRIRPFPRWIVDGHRLAGLLAFFFSLPVAYHCLWSIGFNWDLDAPARVLIHSVTGLLFYGGYVAKVMVVRVKGMPKWAVPVTGGFIFATLILALLTSVIFGFSNFSEGLF